MRFEYGKISLCYVKRSPRKVRHCFIRNLVKPILRCNSSSVIQSRHYFCTNIPLGLRYTQNMTSSATVRRFAQFKSLSGFPSRKSQFKEQSDCMKGESARTQRWGPERNSSIVLPRVHRPEVRAAPRQLVKVKKRFVPAVLGAVRRGGGSQYMHIH